MPRPIYSVPEILALVRQGLNDYEVARRIGCSPSLARNVRNKIGRSPAKRRWTTREAAAVRRGLDAGRSAVEIAAEINRPVDGVRSFIRDAGLMGSRAMARVERQAIGLARIAAGAKLKDIAAALGVTYHAVWKWRTEAIKAGYFTRGDDE